MKKIPHALVSLALLAGYSLDAGAYPFVRGDVVRVSGRSPFVGCTADDVEEQSGTVYLHSEVEPWVDVNPADRSNVVGAWQQDRWSNGGARGLVAGVSFDGGDTWTDVPIPGTSLCTGGEYDRATDPWVSFGPTGRVHQLALSFNDVAAPLEPRDFDHALLASYSDDGGLTWSDPEVVIRDTDANVFNDKQTITADPHNPNFVYAVWDRLIFPPSERASVQASFRTAAYRGPAWFARSTDGGETWERARPIFDPGQNDQTISNQIVVLPNGDLVNVMAVFNGENRDRRSGWSVAVLRSENRGRTWSGPIYIGALNTIGIEDPDTGDLVRTGDIIPDIAVDEDTGALYAVWQDARFSGFEFDSIALSQSLDGGRSWSEPVKVNRTPRDEPPGDQQAFTPSVDVSGDGTVAVTYYDFRNNTPDPSTLWTDHFLIHCHSSAAAACTARENWTDQRKLTEESFDMRDAPFARGFFVGDYVGLASAARKFRAFFSATHGSDPGSIFFREVRPNA